MKRCAAVRRPRSPSRRQPGEGWFASTLETRAPPDRRAGHGAGSRSGACEHGIDDPSHARRLALGCLRQSLWPDPPLCSQCTHSGAELAPITIAVGRPCADRLECRDLVERQGKSIGVAADVKSHPADPARRRSDDREFVDGWHLCRHAQSTECGPSCRTRPAFTRHFQRHIQRSEPGLSKPTLEPSEGSARVRPDDGGVRSCEPGKRVLHGMARCGVLREVRDTHETSRAAPG